MTHHFCAFQRAADNAWLAVEYLCSEVAYWPCPIRVEPCDSQRQAQEMASAWAVCQGLAVLSEDALADQLLEDVR